MWDDVLELSGVAQGRLIRQGALSSAELIEIHLKRIACVNPALNAAVEVLDDAARRAARLADQRKAAGGVLSPFDGVPFSIKNSIEVQGTVCDAGTIGLQSAHPSAHDATLVARLRAAGAIPIAKTNLPDLLFSFETDNLIHGRTNNPFDLSRTPGGSSGGEAALIAACGSPFGLGSDAAGSIRLPAHFCGIAGIKPTSGRLPRTGHIPPASGWIEMLWQIGPMARYVEDLCAILPVLLGPDGQDHTVVDMPYPTPPKTCRIAFFTGNRIAAPDDDTECVVRSAAEELARQGFIVEQHLPPGIDESYELEMKLIGADGGDGLRSYLGSIGSHRTHPLLEGWLSKLDRYRMDPAGLAQYWERLHQFRARLFRFFQDYEAILSPACATPAIPHGASLDENIFAGFSYTMSYNLTGWPAAVVRCGTSATGLPVNLQVAAHPWREDLALAIAQRLESSLGRDLPRPLREPKGIANP
jgi:amidase